MAVNVRGTVIARLVQLGSLLGTVGGDHVLEEHVVGGCEADAGAQQVLNAGPLLEECVDDGRTLRHLRRLAQVRQHRQHRAQWPVVGDGAFVDTRHRNAAAQLGKQRQVQDQRRRQQRVLASVVHNNGVVAAQHDLGRVLVHRALAVA